MKINFFQAIIQALITAIEGEIGQVIPAPSAEAVDVDSLVAYQPTSQYDAAVHLKKLHAALISATDGASIGKILIAIGGIVLAFFPAYAQEAQFLIDIGTALETGGSGTVGPIRIGNLGLTLSWAPWPA